jgi:hypothetical protein
MFQVQEYRFCSVKWELVQIKTVSSKNISQFEFLKPFKRLFLRYGKEKYRQSCLSSNKSP